VALLKRVEPNKPKFFCGAVLVSRNKVLTAAHCIQNKNSNQPIHPREVIIFLGAHDLSDAYQPGTLSVSPSQIIVHPE
jgi:secreted trypsin-like serine protease